MKSMTFRVVARKIAATVGRQSGIEVRFQGKTASTTGTLIVLPAVVADTTLTKLEASVMLGYLDHEIGHVRETDFSIVEEATLLGRLNKNIWNILEDVRMERAYIQKYPGARYDLDILCDKLERDYSSLLAERGESLGEVDMKKAGELLYEEAYTFRGRPRMRKESLGDFKELSNIKKWVRDAAYSSSSKVVLKYSELIVAELKRLFPEEQEQERTGDSSSLVAPDTGEEDQKGSSQVGSGEEDQKGSSQVGTGEEGQEGSSQVGSEEALCELLEALTDKSGKLTDFVKELVERDKERETGEPIAPKSYQGTEIIPPVTTADDRIFYYPEEDLPQYYSTLGLVGEGVRRLKKGLRIMLQSRKMKSNERGMETGALDSLGVWKIKTGETKRIFVQKREVSMVNTAVCLMLDLSASMETEITRATAIMVSEALLGIPSIKLEIAGFTCTSAWAGTSSGPGGRANPMHVPLFKGYNDVGRRVRGRIGALKTSGYTPLGEGMAYGYDSLLSRVEKKRVLLVVTDGQPEFSSNDKSHNDLLLMDRVHRKCSRDGIWTVGFEIGDCGLHLEKYTDVSVKVKGIEDLPVAVLEMIRGVMGGSLHYG